MIPEPADARSRVAGNLIFVSGRIAADALGLASEAQIAPALPYYGSSIKKQTYYILHQFVEELEQVGSSLEHVVKAHVFHTDLGNFDAFDEVWGEFFPQQPPCRATVAFPETLVPGCVVLIDLIGTFPGSPPRARSSDVPRAPVNYTEILEAGDLVFASGLMASDYKTGVPCDARIDPAFPYYGSDIKHQTRYILHNFQTTFQAAGASLGDVVKAYVYLRDLSDFNGFDEVWKEFFPFPPPRTTVGVSDLLVRDALVEIDLVAAQPSAPREVVAVPDIPQPLANYAPALRVGGLVFAAGGLATDFKAGVAPEANVNSAFPYYGSAIKRQTRYILDNLDRTFRAAGTSLDNVVKAQVFLTDLANFNGFNEVWQERFLSPPPCSVIRTTALLIEGCLVEIDLIAATG